MDEGIPVRARIRRWYAPNAVYFITCVTRQRRALFADEANLLLLRETLRRVQRLHPFGMRGYAFLPDHFHLLILVPEETNVSTLMQSVQWNYTRNYKRARGIRTSLKLWQRGFWDHVIRDEDDFARHLDYIHYNPVKHGLVAEAKDYPHTSFREYLRRSWYGGVPLGEPSLVLGGEGSEP